MLTIVILGSITKEIFTFNLFSLYFYEYFMLSIMNMYFFFKL